MSLRGIASGVAGSVAVAVVAVLSLGAAHAAADTESAKDAHARVTPAVQSAPVRPLLPQPAWLRRLLSKSDLPMEAPHHKS